MKNRFIKNAAVHNCRWPSGRRSDADLYAPDGKLEEAVTTLEPLLFKYAENRQPEKSLSDFYQRPRGTDTRRRVKGKKGLPRKPYNPDLFRLVFD